MFAGRMTRAGGLSFTKEDLAKIDEAIAVLRQLYGFAPGSRAELVRIAVEAFLEGKRREWTEKHPSGTRTDYKSGRKREG